jgi:hypothetical protein
MVSVRSSSESERAVRIERAPKLVEVGPLGKSTNVLVERSVHAPRRAEDLE